MKFRFMGMWAMMLGCYLFVSAQEGGYSEEELTIYAKVMKWAEMEQQKMSENISSSIMENEKLSASAYNSLKEAMRAGDVNSTDASEEEVSEFMAVQKRIEDMKANFKEVYTNKIKEDIGASLYNRLRKSLKSDADTKARYEEIYANVELVKEEDTE